MSTFTLQVRVHQQSSEWFNAIEQTVYGWPGYAGAWSTSGDERILQLDANCSGAIRFTNAAGDFVVFAVGILGSGIPWTDIATDLGRADTGVRVHPSWYGKDGSRSTDRDWKNSRTAMKTDAKGHKLSIAVTGTETALVADITFA